MKVRDKNRFATPRTPREVADGIWLLGTQRVNFYALVEGRAITLVDTGFYGYLRYLNDWLAATNRTISGIEAVVLTHGHGDHSGFAGELARRGVPVYVHADDIEKVIPGRREIPPKRLRSKWWLALGVLGEAVTDGVLWQPPIPGARAFTDGQHLEGPGQVRAVHVPGHSIGNCSLYHPGLDLMFTGDTLMTRDPIFGGEDGPVVFSADPIHDEICLKNLELLRPFASAGLLPGHGEPDLSQGALGTAISHARIARAGVRRHADRRQLQ